MENGHWAIPWSACFVMKDLRDFDAQKCSMDVSFTVILRMKLSGLPEEDLVKVRKFILGNLKCRVNEEESLMIGEGAPRSGKVNQVYSSERKEDKSKSDAEQPPKDLLQYTLRLKESFFTEFEEYAQFPFDVLPFKYRFELSHFELDKETYRFDFYNTKHNWISWKEGCDFLPEFDIDFQNTTIETLIEAKPHKMEIDGEKKEVHCRYYPGFTLQFASVRDPYSKMIKLFVPSAVLMIFLLCTFFLEVDALNDRLASISICLLAYVEILDSLRDEMPQIQSLTYGDLFVVVYILSSALPIVYMLGSWVPEETETEPVTLPEMEMVQES